MATSINNKVSHSDRAYALELNQQLLNEEVYFAYGNDWRRGTVVGIVDWETFLVSDDVWKNMKVNMHHIRSVDSSKY